MSVPITSQHQRVLMRECLGIKTEITEALESEIVSRYYLEKGEIEASFDDDVDIQAALGISQLKRLDSFVSRRREIVKQYFDKLDNSVLPYQHPDANSSWHLFVIQKLRAH